MNHVKNLIIYVYLVGIKNLMLNKYVKLEFFKYIYLNILKYMIIKNYNMRIKK